MPFSATTTALNIGPAGMWVACAAVVATAGWSSVPCLIAGAYKILRIVVGVASDAYDGTTKDAHGNPDRRGFSDYPSLSDLVLHQGSHQAPTVPFNYGLYQDFDHYVSYNLTHIEQQSQHTLERRGPERVHVTVTLPNQAPITRLLAL